MDNLQPLELIIFAWKKRHTTETYWAYFQNITNNSYILHSWKSFVNSEISSNITLKGKENISVFNLYLKCNDENEISAAKSAA